ncbi:hypothetical protein [uncultured Brevundimonas sp.]|uniref:hypothetical protein n=1 Tax=uncultured Brevundimonas sp. TaxID=213418 RepID=UPI0026351DA7|nr:hypothetical protein [uncultured Brevundimonas sp.]
MGVEVAFKRGEDGALVVGHGAVAANDRHAEFGQHRRDVHVLELDRFGPPTDAGVEGAGALRLDEDFARRLGREHGEILGNDGVEFVDAPVGSYF